jgi:hypothetical protein
MNAQQKLTVIRQLVLKAKVTPQVLLLNSTVYKEFKENPAIAALIDKSSPILETLDDMILVPVDFIESFVLLAPVPYKQPSITVVPPTPK